MRPIPCSVLRCFGPLCGTHCDLVTSVDVTSARNAATQTQLGVADRSALRSRLLLGGWLLFPGSLLPLKESLRLTQESLRFFVLRESRVVHGLDQPREGRAG